MARTGLSRAASEAAVSARLRDFLDWTFRRAGYVRESVDPPVVIPASEEMRELIVREFELLLLSATEPTDARALLRQAVDKVREELRRAEVYSREGLTDDERLVSQHVGEIMASASSEA